MLIDVLIRFCAESGVDINGQRPLALMYLNNAASEIYKQLECNKIYREISLLVPPDKIVSMPGFIGELKGLRMHTEQMPFDLHSMTQPRYVNNTYQYKFKNWRDVGESPIKLSLNSVAPLTITSQAIEAVPVTLKISGQTNLAETIEESIVLSASPVNTVNNFGPNIWKIACLATRTGNITITDAAGNEVAVLYNNQSATRYKIVDVSKLFWTFDTTDSSIIDVLYKEPLRKLSNDIDSFPAGDDYDDAWFYTAMYLFYKPQQDKQNESSSFKAQSEAAMVSVKSTTEDIQVKKISFGPNKYYDLVHRYGNDDYCP